MVLDESFSDYSVSYPFQITRFRSLCEHRWEAGYHFPGERHNFWEFSLVLEGEEEATGDDGVVHLIKPGTFSCVRPMVFHSTLCTKGPSHVLNFSFEHTGILPDTLSRGIFYLFDTEIKTLSNIFFQLQRAYQSQPQDPVLGAEATLSLTAFLLRLSQNHTPQYSPADSVSSRMYRQLVQAMHDKLYDNFTVQQLAQHCAVSVTTAKELFRRHAGIGPKRYYSELRLNEAMRLLLAGRSLEEITEKLNYSSTNYFSCCFKQHFGLPPGQYRRQHWDKNE